MTASRWASFSTEILVVDNGSTDSTPEVLRDLAQKYPELRGDQRPVLAHEGQYHDHPLRAGDPVPRTP